MPAPYEPESSLPGVPHTGARMPTQSQMVNEMLQRQHGNKLAGMILAADSRAQAVTAMMARGVAGDGASQWIQEDKGKLSNLGISSMINSNMMSGFTGGSSLDMAFGIQNAVGRGMRISSGGQQQMFSGRGFVNDSITSKLFDRVQGDFYGTLGAAKLQRTQGYDRGEVGQAFNALGERGAFTGINIGELKQAGDKNSFALDEGAVKKIKDLTAAALKTVRGLTDITGDRNIRNMMDLAERATGGDMTTVAGAEAVRAKVEHITRTAGLIGENPQSMLARVVNMGGGADAITAVTASANTFQAATEQRRRLMDQGVWTAAPNQQAIEHANLAGMKAVKNEEKEAMGALWVMQNYGLKDDEKAGIQQRITAITAGKDWHEKAAARAELSRYTKGMTGGVALASIFNQQGGAEGIMAGLNDENKQFGSDFARKEDMSRLFNINMREMSAVNRLDKIAGLKSGSVAKIGTDVFGTLDKGSQNQLIDALQKDDISGARAAIKNSTGFDSEKDRQAAMDRLNNAVVDGSTGQLGKALSLARVNIANNPLMNNAESKGDAELARDSANRRKMDERKFGTGAAETDLISAFVRGMAGGENIGDTQILQYAENRKDPAMVKMQLNKDATAFTDIDAFTGTQLEKMDGLAKALGVDNKADALKGALGTSKGVAAFTDYLNKKGYNWQTDGDNKLRALNSDASKASEDNLSKESTRAIVKGLTGADDAKIDDIMSSPSKLGAMLASNSDKILDGLNDPKSDTGQMLSAFRNQNKDAYGGLLDTMISKRQDAVAFKKDHWFHNMTSTGASNTDEKGNKFEGDRAKKELDQLLKAKSQFAADGKEGDMIGRVKMIIGDDLVMELYKSRGLDSK